MHRRGNLEVTKLFFVKITPAHQIENSESYSYPSIPHSKCWSTNFKKTLNFLFLLFSMKKFHENLYKTVKSLIFVKPDIITIFDFQLEKPLKVYIEFSRNSCEMTKITKSIQYHEEAIAPFALYFH